MMGRGGGGGGCPRIRTQVMRLCITYSGLILSAGRVHPAGSCKCVLEVVSETGVTLRSLTTTFLLAAQSYDRGSEAAMTLSILSACNAFGIIPACVTARDCDRCVGATSDV